MPPVLSSLQTSTAVVDHRPRSIAEWRRNGVDYAVDKGIDVGGVLISVFVLWYFIRFVSRRIEKLGSDGHDHLHTAREQRARTAAKLVRHLGRAVLTVVGVLMVLNQLDFNISPLLASAGVIGLAISFGSQSLVRDYVTGFFLQLEHQFALGNDPAWADSLLDPPQVTGIEKISGGAVTLRTVARVDPYRRDDVARDLRTRIKQSLDVEGIATFAPPALPAT